MGLTIAQKADTLGTIRFVSVHLMETLAAWVPTSPELEVKTLFGRHIWQVAQHADLIGRRTVELRAKLHYERPPVDAYRSALTTLRGATSSGDRIAGLYDAALPDLSARLDAYLAATDDLLDAPTVDILRRMLSDYTRMQEDRRRVAAERPDLPAHDERWLAELTRALSQCVEMVDHRAGVPA